MTNEELFKIIRPIIMRVTGVSACILGDPNAPAPLGSYCAVRPHSHTAQRGQANVTMTDGNDRNIVTSVKAQLKTTLAIDFYRSKAVEYATRLLQFNRLPSVSEEAMRNKIGILGTSSVSNLTKLVSANQEERAHIEVYIWHEGLIADTVNSIEIVEFVLSDDKNRELMRETVDSLYERD